MSNSTKIVTGYMCLTDYQYALGEAATGVCIYPSLEDLRDYAPCVGKGCGWIKVTVQGTGEIGERSV
jgi:hypothetical protein